MSDSELTRPADAAWAPLVRGQRITVTHGDFSGDYRVVNIAPGHGGSETYHLKPAAEVDALVNRAADLVMDELAAQQASDAIEREIAPYDLLAEPKAYVFLTPGWAERLKELAPRAPMYCRCTVLPIEDAEYCNICENFPCLGGHPPAG